MQNENSSKFTIITGKYETGTIEQKNTVSKALGENNTEYKYKIYFHWYNVIHELGHVILHFNEHKQLTNVEEEELVNIFAAAYWSYYGETLKSDDLKAIVQTSLTCFTSPAPAGIDYKTYAQENWGKPEFFTFNNYGWFQFSSVLNALKNQTALPVILQEMARNEITSQPKQVLTYDIEETDLPLKIIRDASSILREWGICIPALPHLMVDDPFRHGISTVGY